jgi:hypothetical protein
MAGRHSRGRAAKQSDAGIEMSMNEILNDNAVTMVYTQQLGHSSFTAESTAALAVATILNLLLQSFRLVIEIFQKSFL